MRINLNPKKWGPNTWNFLESCVIGYPDNPTNENKNNFKNFFYSLIDVLPCEKCRFNYKIHINKYPLTDEILSNKDDLFKWILNIHNLSSKKNYNFTDSIKYYNNYYSEKNLIYKIKYLVLFLLFILILLYISNYFIKKNGN